MYALQFSNRIVGHNIDFDYKVIKSELIRNNYHDYLKPYPKFCMMKSKSILNYYKIIKGENQIKWPKLKDSYRLLFKGTIKNEQYALADAENCIKCFFELKRLCII
jgi:hypothetical protein